MVTDVRTGEVKALVTYPSYDNNLMSGSVDAVYFAQLQDDMSKPLYNNATQPEGPGSTFKPITAVAALEEGVIGLQDTVECTGIYDQGFQSHQVLDLSGTAWRREHRGGHTELL